MRLANPFHQVLCQHYAQHRAINKDKPLPENVAHRLHREHGWKPSSALLLELSSSNGLFWFIACHFLQRRARLCHLWLAQTVESSHSRKDWARRRCQALLKKMTGVYPVYVNLIKQSSQESYSCNLPY